MEQSSAFPKPAPASEPTKWAEDRRPVPQSHPFLAAKTTEWGANLHTYGVATSYTRVCVCVCVRWLVHVGARARPRVRRCVRV